MLRTHSQTHRYNTLQLYEATSQRKEVEREMEKEIK
jgi:hypothetical protein